MSEYISVPRGAVTVISSPMGDLWDPVTAFANAFFTPEFNSTKYPGICKPSNDKTMAKFRLFQQQLNRVAQMRSYTKIADDGDIGPGTVALATKVLSRSFSGCSELASGVISFTSTAKSIADGLSAPAVVPGPAPIKPPTIVTKAGVEILAKTPGFLDGVSTPVKVAAVGMGAGILYLLVFKKKRK